MRTLQLVSAAYALVLNRLPSCRAGNQAIVHLMSRNTHLEFGFASICTFFVLYYFGAAIVAGSCGTILSRGSFESINPPE